MKTTLWLSKRKIPLISGKANDRMENFDPIYILQSLRH